MITTNRFNSWLQTHSVLLLVHLLTYAYPESRFHTQRETRYSSALISLSYTLIRIYDLTDCNWDEKFTAYIQWLLWPIQKLSIVSDILKEWIVHLIFNILQPFQVRNVGALVLCKLVNVSFYYCPLTQHITNNKAEWAQADQQPLVYKPFLNCDFVQVTWLISAYLKRSLSRKYLC